MVNDSLYVMAFTSEGTDWTKIGRAVDVEARKKQLQANRQHEVRLIKEYPEQGGRETVALRHMDKLAALDQRTGWYRVSPDSVVGLIDEILRSVSMDPEEIEQAERAARRMVMKTNYYARSQLDRLKRLARELEVPEAKILREALETRLLQADL